MACKILIAAGSPRLASLTYEGACNIMLKLGLHIDRGNVFWHLCDLAAGDVGITSCLGAVGRGMASGATGTVKAYTTARLYTIA